MALSINSCLKPSSPPIPPPSLSPESKTILIPWPASGDPSWRRGCVSTVACVIISSAIGLTDGEGGAMLVGDITAVEVAEGRMKRWSDKRKCPPWHVNSLENIMPENLPRPWSRRRSNSIVAHDQTAPDVGFLAKYNTSCFSL